MFKKACLTLSMLCVLGLGAVQLGIANNAATAATDCQTCKDDFTSCLNTYDFYYCRGVYLNCLRSC